ncbi:MAG: hypothetical protein C4523_08855 [Myxococcales bacterium]|nr:MAG: hypothetical protein C4523_08855 [Myxococcales bacterium]
MGLFDAGVRGVRGLIAASAPFASAAFTRSAINPTSVDQAIDQQPGFARSWFAPESDPWGELSQVGVSGFTRSGMLNPFGFTPEPSSQRSLPTVGGTPGTNTSLTTLGGEWSGVDQWNDAIARAAAAVGIPANMIKAVMKLESNGNPGAGGAPGVVGLMQINTDPDVWGSGPWNTDNAANIQKGAEILKYYYDRAGGDWYEALRGYHGYGSDGNTTDREYADIVLGNFERLSQSGNALISPGLGSGGSPGGQQFSAIWGQGDAPETFGFNAYGGPDLYGYSTSYGLDGQGHTGVDIGLTYQSPLYAPLGGVVTCAGTNVGGGAGGGGCGAFRDTGDAGPEGPDQGVGRIELLLDNGVVLILGHSRTVNVAVGQRVSAGQLIGTSGGMYGAHVHIEARVPDASTASNFRIVDPRAVLGGSFSGTNSPATNPALGGYANDLGAVLRYWLGY